MPRHSNPIYQLVANAVHEALISLGCDSALDVNSIYDLLTSPPNLELGHIAFPCFPLAKSMRKGPAVIAQSLAAETICKDGLSKVVAEGPYLNFFLEPSALGQKVADACRHKTYYDGAQLRNPQKVMIEYSQPNTHKELHVGHMRNLCLGNALVKISRHCGVETISATYPGDVGTHVAKCLWYMQDRFSGNIPTENKGQWLGSIYAEATSAIEATKNTEEGKVVSARLTQILKELHSKEGEFYELWKETRQWSLDLMEKAYAWADVSFDRWFFESEVDEPSISYMKQLYDEGKIQKDEGALGMNLEDEKLGFCLLVKSDGTGLYSTKDVELARKKFEEFGIERSVYVVDNRQAHHFKQVFKVLEKLGFPQAKDCFHLQYEMVELPDGAMSSRKGNIVPLLTLIERMEQAVIDDHLNKYQGQWSEQEIKDTAKAIANGAIKYGMLRVDNNRKITFDIKEWVKLDGETGPYLQYVHARIRSLEEKCGSINEEKIQWNMMTSPQEVALLVHLNEFNQVLIQAAKQLKTINLCSYLYDLAKRFNSFYNNCPILKAENEQQQHTRLALAQAVRSTMKVGLSLLGIPAPDRM